MVLQELTWLKITHESWYAIKNNEERMIQIWEIILLDTAL